MSALYHPPTVDVCEPVHATMLKTAPLLLLATAAFAQRVPVEPPLRPLQLVEGYLLFDVVFHEQVNKQRRALMFFLDLALKLKRTLVLPRARVLRRTNARGGFDPKAEFVRMGDLLNLSALRQLHPAKLTCTPRGLRTVRTGYTYQPAACCTYQRRRAACPWAPRTVRTPYAYQPRPCRRYRVPWHPRHPVMDLEDYLAEHAEFEQHTSMGHGGCVNNDAPSTVEFSGLQVRAVKSTCEPMLPHQLPAMIKLQVRTALDPAAPVEHL